MPAVCTRSCGEFDADGVDAIYSESFDREGIGAAVMNRLLKAAGHQIVKLPAKEQD